MPNVIDLISISFSTEKSQTYKLSIRETPNGFYFCVVEEEPQIRCLAIKHTKRIDNNEPLLSLTYKKSVIVKDSVFGIIPQSLYEEDSSYLFLAADKQQRKRAKVEKTLLPDNNIIVFDTRRFSNIPHTEKRHPLHNLYILGRRENEHTYIAAEISDGKLHIVTVKDNQLIQMNSFECDIMEDYAYFILASYQQFNLDIEKAPLYLSGKLSGDKNPQQFLKEYIRNVHVVEPKFTWENNFPKEYYPLFATQIEGLLCE